MFGSLFNKLRKRSRSAAPPQPTVDWAPIIYSYVTGLCGEQYDSKREDRARRELNDRGLAFGQLRVTDGSRRSLRLVPLDPLKANIARVRKAVSEAIAEAGLSDRLSFEEGMTEEDLIVIRKDPKDKTLPGSSVMGFKGDATYSYVSVFSLECRGERFCRAEVVSEAALRIVLRALQLLGLNAGAKHYANESPVPIENIVVYAARWEDPESHCRYLDVLYRPQLVKHHVMHGCMRCDERSDGDYKGEVVASTAGVDWWPRISINNRPVYSTIVDTPTAAMLSAKQKIAAEAVNRCGCGKLASRRVVLTRFKMDSDFGGFSSGGVRYVCESEKCLENAKNSEKHIEASVTPYAQEIW